MEKKSEVSEHNFTEGKAVRRAVLCTCAKLNFMIKNFEKWREVMVLNFFNLVLKMIPNRRTPTPSSHRLPVKKHSHVSFPTLAGSRKFPARFPARQLRRESRSDVRALFQSAAENREGGSDAIER